MNAADANELYMIPAEDTPGENREQFYRDVLKGLNSDQKQLPSKYFYDAVGDRLFQDIMECPEYYVTRCEMEIFSSRAREMAELIMQSGDPFYLIELGPGDCTKSEHLLRALVGAGADYTYVPVDISGDVIRNLETTLPDRVPGLKVCGRTGDYRDLPGGPGPVPDRRKVILCLGGNIGNMTPADTRLFTADLRSSLSCGDICIIGFDLKKDPEIIRRAYDDAGGITRAFNLNLLERMNRELQCDFPVEYFKHYSSYDPETGACKSYLVCMQDLEVRFPTAVIPFRKDECIWTEISQKYTLLQIEQLGRLSGFDPAGYFMDSKGWFSDVVWTAVGR
ncbi:MAG TPA: L-histidine N(alpha)-methyltransferase [Sphingobacteriaceae bacterium]